MSINRSTPAQTYRCSEHGCSVCLMYAEGVMTRKVAVEGLRRMGHQVFDGEFRCKDHSTESPDALVALLRPSLAVATVQRALRENQLQRQRGARGARGEQR